MSHGFLEDGKWLMEKKMKMKNLSSISPLESILLHFYWAYIIYIYYESILLIPLNDYAIGRSKGILIICITIASIVGTILRWEKCMTTKGVFADIMTGVGIYTIMAYKEDYNAWVKVVLSIIIVLFIGYAVLIFGRKSKGQFILSIKNNNRKWFIIKSRMIRMLNVVDLFLGLLMFILIIPITFNSVYLRYFVVDDAKTSSVSEIDTYYIENEWGLTHNIDSISKIRKAESWDPLTTTQKLSVLQDICNCETKYWGMNFGVTITVDNLKEHTLGSYCDAEKRIVIDKQHLENGKPEIILSTVLHEMYHAWECSLVRLYLDSSESQRKMRVFEHCDEYIKELSNYQDGGEDFESFMSYYCQYLERDCRIYAAETVKDYYDEIDSILEKQKTEKKEGGIKYEPEY